MKVELKKEENIDGDIFYQIYVNDKFVKGFFESVQDRLQHAISGETNAKKLATLFYKEMQERKDIDYPIVTILETTEILTHETLHK